LSACLPALSGPLPVLLQLARFLPVLLA
jgi:hypothetical protein